MKTVSRATVDDLYRVPDNAKAELVGGELVRMSPTGTLPSAASGAIYASRASTSEATVAAEPTPTTRASSSTSRIVGRCLRTPHSTGTPASR
jgi:hypothetical protein